VLLLQMQRACTCCQARLPLNITLLEQLDQPLQACRRVHNQGVSRLFKA
jgi:hypothetical protein